MSAEPVSPSPTHLEKPHLDFGDDDSPVKSPRRSPKSPINSPEKSLDSYHVEPIRKEMLGGSSSALKRRRQLAMQESPPKIRKPQATSSFIDLTGGKGDPTKSWFESRFGPMIDKPKPNPMADVTKVTKHNPIAARRLVQQRALENLRKKRHEDLAKRIEMYKEDNEDLYVNEDELDEEDFEVMENEEGDCKKKGKKGTRPKSKSKTPDPIVQLDDVPPIHNEHLRENLPESELLNLSGHSAASAANTQLSMPSSLSQWFADQNPRSGKEANTADFETDGHILQISSFGEPNVFRDGLEDEDLLNLCSGQFITQEQAAIAARSNGSVEKEVIVLEVVEAPTIQKDDIVENEKLEEDDDDEIISNRLRSAKKSKIILDSDSEEEDENGHEKNPESGDAQRADKRRDNSMEEDLSLLSVSVTDVDVTIVSTDESFVHRPQIQVELYDTNDIITEPPQRKDANPEQSPDGEETIVRRKRVVLDDEDGEEKNEDSGSLDDNEIEDEEEYEESEGEQEEEENMNMDDDEGKDGESDGEIDENDELAVIKRLEKETYKKMVRSKKFVDDEASLSGDDVGSDIDENELGDEYELDEADNEVYDEEELRRKNIQLVLKQQSDADHRELVRIQERLLTDGDLAGTETNRSFRFRLREDFEAIEGIGEEGVAGGTQEDDEKDEAERGDWRRIFEQQPSMANKENEEIDAMFFDRSVSTVNISINEAEEADVELDPLDRPPSHPSSIQSPVASTSATITTTITPRPKMMAMVARSTKRLLTVNKLHTVIKDMQQPSTTPRSLYVANKMAEVSINTPPTKRRANSPVNQKGKEDSVAKRKQGKRGKLSALERS